MNVAFYAPLKAPTQGNPSGDRYMAQLLLEALRGAGCTVHLACRLRSRDGKGDAQRQRRLRQLAVRCARRLLARYAGWPEAQRPHCWFTYHLYYKAPDWLGPIVSRSLQIPYIVAEASYAPKRAGGPWDLGHQATRQAIEAAHAVLSLNSSDAACLQELIDEPRRLVTLKPFLDAGRFARPQGSQRRRLEREWGFDPGVPWLTCVAMMRPGDKLSSYRLLAQALGRILDKRWHLLVVGDGTARDEVHGLFAGLPRERVAFVGRRDPKEVSALLNACDLFVWPAVNEAYGMALLEAQAAGLAVVAGRSGGVADIVRDGVTGRLVPAGDEHAFAKAIASLLEDEEQRATMGARAQRVVVEEHDISVAQGLLERTLERAVAGKLP